LRTDETPITLPCCSLGQILWMHCRKVFLRCNCFISE
jgi:hypothetical protein